MKSIFGRSLLSIAVIGSCLGSVLLLTASVSAQVNGPGTVSYTHLTLPTTPYV